MKEVLVLPTERPTVVLRELATAQDDIDYLAGIKEDPAHVDNYLNEVASRYGTLEKVRDARLNAGDDIRMGIRDIGDFKGGIGARVDEEDKTQTEIGLWLRRSATGQGYATLAIKALTV